jgi:hypothetical protein
MMRNMLPKDYELPISTYEAKKVVCPLGLEVQKIHACPNDCILYRDDYENLTEYPICTILWYKIRGDDPSDVEGESSRKRSWRDSCRGRSSMKKENTMWRMRNVTCNLVISM